MKPLRNGRYGAGYQQMHSFALHFVPIPLVAAVLVYVLIVVLRRYQSEPFDNSFAIRYCLGCFLLSTMVLSCLFWLSYNDWRNHEYYLADFPKGSKSWWIFPYLLMWLGFPFLIVSYICMQRAKRHYRRADEEARRTRETAWAETQKAGKVKPEEQAAIQANLQICAQNCWEIGLIEQHGDLAKRANQMREEIGQLQALLDQKQQEFDELAEELEYKPQDAQIGPDLRASMEQCLQKLCGLPEVAQVKVGWYDPTMVRNFQIVIHLTDNPDDPQYDLGDYRLMLENDGADYYTYHLECTRSGMTEQGKALDRDREGKFIVAQGLPEHQAEQWLQAGLIPEAVVALMDAIRKDKLRDLEPEALGEYYLLLAPLRDR